MAPHAVELSEMNRVVIVVGLDFTDASEYALRLATSLVRSVGPQAELHLVHVTAPPYWYAVHGSDAPAPLPSEDTAEVRMRLLDACFTFGQSVVASVTPHVRAGDPTAEIADLAREVDADLIVVGSHKRKGLARALHRSTYARLVRRAPCSVLAALPKDEVQIEPPCEACVSVRRQSGGVIQWCKQHSEPHIHPRTHHGAQDPIAAGSWDFRA
jgi:nucleotide-binding universal stress UspA family protein